MGPATDTQATGRGTRAWLNDSMLEPARATLSRNASAARRRSELALTRVVWWAAEAKPAWLTLEDLERLQPQYPFRPGYHDPQGRLQRARARAQRILALPGADVASRFLEVGCRDGMTCAILKQAGREAMGIDVDDQRFDARLKRDGVVLRAMDAAKLALEDESVDHAFSFDAFEHFADPTSVLREMTRVVRPGGHIYLDFGPLYYSPSGEHAWRTITVPYCQFLFPKHVLNRYSDRHGLEPIRWNRVNRWPSGRYRSLWPQFSNELEMIFEHEHCNLEHLAQIRRHPGCFKHASLDFDDFLVESMMVLFRKRAPA
jgi:ubiquinone/menaquinone biosynthesis C-methylase UbiE